MNPVSLFLVGVLATALLSWTAVRYLRAPLHAVLVDICGTDARAAFWTAFSSLTIGLTPVMFAMHYRPQDGADTRGVFEIGTQIELALAGLLISIVVLGLILSKFIARQMETMPKRVGTP